MNAESGDCMGIPAKNLTAAKKYLRTMEKNFLEAWKMGFHDADAGRDQRPTPCPDSIKPGTTAYAAVSFAREVYIMGYRAGKRVHKE